MIDSTTDLRRLRRIRKHIALIYMIKINCATKITGAMAAVCMTVFATADKAGVTEDAAIRAVDAGSSEAAVATDDDMASFLAVVANVLVKTDLSDNPATEKNNQAVASATTTGAAPPVTGGLHQRHLGLGFAHGMSNGIDLRKTIDDGPLEFIPPTDVCQGHGHIGIPSALGNAIGHADCGDPSPSD
jgi:hypothetical protein